MNNSACNLEHVKDVLVQANRTLSVSDLKLLTLCEKAGTVLLINDLFDKPIGFVCYGNFSAESMRLVRDFGHYPIEKSELSDGLLRYIFFSCHIPGKKFVFFRVLKRFLGNRFFFNYKNSLRYRVGYRVGYRGRGLWFPG